MEESQAGYKEIDDALENRIRKPKEGISNDQYYKIQIDLLNTIKRRSLEEKLDPSEYETRLYKAFDVLSDLKSSLSQGYWEKTDPPHWSQDEQLIWFHRPAGQILWKNKETEPIIDGNSLSQVAADYLANPWMQISQIDWILLDSLLYAELAGNREDVYSGKAIGEIKLDYIWAGEDTSKQVLARAKITIIAFGLRYLLPSIIIGIFIFLRFDKTAMIIGGVYLIYLLFRLILWPARYKEGKSLRF